MKMYCYLIDGKFKALNMNELPKDFGDFGDDMLYDEGIHIGIVEGKNLEEIEEKSIKIVKERFKKLGW